MYFSLTLQHLTYKSTSVWVSHLVLSLPPEINKLYIKNYLNGMTLTNSTVWICLNFYQVLRKTSFLFWLAAGKHCVSYPSRQHCCSPSWDLVSTDSSTWWCQNRYVDVWQERVSLTASAGSVAFSASGSEGSAAF